MKVQPHWFRLWENARDPLLMTKVGSAVLSDPQLRWLAAQAARAVFGGVPGVLRGSMLASIEAAEEHAVGRITDQQMKAAHELAYGDAVPEGASAASRAAIATTDRTAWAAANFAVSQAESSLLSSSDYRNNRRELIADVLRRAMARCPPTLV